MKRNGSAELAEDVAAFDTFARKLATGEEELIPAEIVMRLVHGENPVRVWREHRGLAVNTLAEKAGLSPATLSRIEDRVEVATVEAVRKIATALNVTVDDLI